MDSLQCCTGVDNSGANSCTITRGRSPGTPDLGFLADIIFWYVSKLSIMRGGCSEKIASIANKLETHTRTETVRVKMLIPNSCQKTTPQKRKCCTSMNPESTQHQSDVSSPAKKQKLNTLINFWGGGGAKVKAQFMNNHASSTDKKISNLATTQNTETHARQMSCSGDNPVGGGQGAS